jgi:nucleotide-binding universal stress UspA family protein
MLAKHTDAALWAQAVVDTATIRELELSRIFIAEEAAEYSRELEEDAERQLEVIRTLAGTKKCPINTILSRGSVHAETIEFAMEKKIDLIILGWGSNLKRRQERDRISLEYSHIVRESRVSVLFIKNEDMDLHFKKF